MASPLERSGSFARIEAPLTTYNQPRPQPTEAPPLPSLPTKTTENTEIPLLQPLPASVFASIIPNLDQDAKNHAIGMLIGHLYNHPNALELCKSFNQRIENENKITPLPQPVVEEYLTARRKSTTDTPRPPRNELEKEICKLSNSLFPLSLTEIKRLCKEFHDEIEPQSSASTQRSIKPRSFSAVSAPIPPPLSAVFQSQLAAIVRRQSQTSSAPPSDDKKIQK